LGGAPDGPYRKLIMAEEITNKYKDDLARFLIKYVPSYTSLSPEVLTSMEEIWDAVGNNRMEFIALLNNLRKTRKKRVAHNS
jgi:hypothetical protein